MFFSLRKKVGYSLFNEVESPREPSGGFYYEGYPNLAAVYRGTGEQTLLWLALLFSIF
jgi:hypothetical protein